MLSWIRTNFHPLWRLRRNRLYRWLQNHCDIVVSHRVGGIKEHLYLLRDLSILLPHHGMQEQMGSVFNTVLARLQPELFLDIGANLGGYSWMVFNEIEDCQIWLFEPDRKNAALLQRALDAAKSPRLHLDVCALSNRNGVSSFLIDDASGSAGSIVDQRGTHYNLQDSYALKTTTMVETKTLDKLLESAPTAQRIFAKIDVEGAETMVLEGASATLKQRQPVIMIEAFHDESLRLLQGFDYTVYDLEEDGNYLAVPPDHAALLAPITSVLKTWEPSLNSSPTSSQK